MGIFRHWKLCLRMLEPYDAVWCLGDLVGYGPQPNECIERVRGLPGLICLLGNHDAASMGGIDLEDFNIEAQKSVRWMIEHLTEENKAYLEGAARKNPLQWLHPGAWQSALSDLGIHSDQRRRPA